MGFGMVMESCFDHAMIHLSAYVMGGGGGGGIVMVGLTCAFISQ